jgi:hypothetical protein
VQTNVDNTEQPEENTTVQQKEKQTRKRVDTCMKFYVNDALHRECERKRIIYRMYTPFSFLRLATTKRENSNNNNDSLSTRRDHRRERERDIDMYVEIQSSSDQGMYEDVVVGVAKC